MGEQIKKIKVAWICRVSDPDINDRLKPLKRTPQVAPWISNTANYLSKYNEIELHCFIHMNKLVKKYMIQLNQNQMLLFYQLLYSMNYNFRYLLSNYCLQNLKDHKFIIRLES